MPKLTNKTPNVNILNSSLFIHENQSGVEPLANVLRSYPLIMLALNYYRMHSSYGSSPTPRWIYQDAPQKQTVLKAIYMCMHHAISFQLILHGSNHIEGPYRDDFIILPLSQIEFEISGSGSCGR